MKTNIGERFKQVSKTKIFLLGLLTSLGFFYSFKNTPSEHGGPIAILSHHVGKSNSEDGFVITYPDGTMEKTPFMYNFHSKEGRLEYQKQITNIINQLTRNGYHLISEGSFVPPGTGDVYIFEKK
jgi:hypothetical protein